MRNLLLVWFISVFFAGTAYAEHLTIGDTEIPYSVPQGYILAGDEEPYLTMRRFAVKASPKNVRLLALYIAEESQRKLLKDGAPRLDNYFTLSTISQVQNKTLSLKEFTSLKEGLEQAQEQMKTTLRKQADALIERASEGTMKLSDVNALGSFDETDTSISFMMVSEQLTRVGNQRHVDKQAVISTALLTEGKFLLINQYRLLEPSPDMAAQLDAFKIQSRQVLEGLDFPEGTPKGRSVLSVIGMVLGGALLGGLIGGIIFRIKKKKTHSA